MDFFLFGKRTLYENGVKDFVLYCNSISISEW